MRKPPVPLPKSTPENIAKLRNLLAEQGIEKTFDEARDMFKILRRLIRRSKKMTHAELWDEEEYAILNHGQEGKDAIELILHCRERFQ